MDAREVGALLQGFLDPIDQRVPIGLAPVQSSFKLRGVQIERRSPAIDRDGGYSLCGNVDRFCRLGGFHNHVKG